MPTMVLEWTHTKKIKGNEKPLISKKKNYILTFDFELKTHKFQFFTPHNELHTQTNKNKQIKPYEYLTFTNKFLIQKLVIKSKASNTSGLAPCNDQFWLCNVYTNFTKLNMSLQDSRWLIVLALKPSWHLVQWPLKHETTKNNKNKMTSILFYYWWSQKYELECLKMKTWKKP